MNIIEKSIYDETKNKQRNINLCKIVISALLLCIFGFLYVMNHFLTLQYIAYFLVSYLIVLSTLRVFYEKIYNHYRYINTAVDVIGVLILVKIITFYSEGIVISLYFIPFLLTIIVISGLEFQKFYTALFGFWSIMVSIYLLNFDGLLNKYSPIILFFIISIYLASLYSVHNLNRVVRKISNLKQLEKFTDINLLNEIETNPEILNQSGQQKELVIMFLDIRGFSKLSEKYKADEMFKILNIYLGSFSKILEENGGNVDKYIGDCIMCYFSGKDKIRNSYTSSIKILTRLKEINDDMEEKIGIGIGLHHGEVYAGGLGNTNRMDYTIIGDNVNIASRLESLTREIGLNLVVSKDYHEKIDFENDLKFYGTYSLKGKDNKIEVFAI